MGNIHTVNCVLTSDVMNNKVPSLMKRTCQRMSFRCEKVATTPQCAPKLQMPSQKRVTLKAMPRCSSFDDLSALLPSSKKSDSDPTYLLWKKSFESPRQKPTSVKQTHLARMRRRVHDMSSVISGHLTPKGFPSHINVKKSHRRQTQNCNNNKQATSPMKPLTLPLLDDSPRAERKIPVMSSDGYSHHHYHQHCNKIQQELLLLMPTHINMTNKIPNATHKTHSTQPKYTLAPLNLLSKLPESKQAIIIEKLYRDIKDLESCYDTKMDSFVL